MSDFNSELPVRTSLPGQVNSDDFIVKIGDATNPTTQLATVDTHGSLQSVIRDPAGNAIGDQLLSASYWLQVVNPSNGATGSAVATFSNLAGGVYNDIPIALGVGQQSGLQLDVYGRLLVDAAIAFPYDTGWGAVDPVTTLRTAAEIGNATGNADFNAGATGAQTLRVVANQGAPGLATNAWFTKITDGTNTASVTASGELSVQVTQPLPAGANNIGSVNQGTSPWVVSGTVTANQGGTWTVGLSEDHNWGVVGANTLRTAAEIGNATGAADFGAGAATAQTLRTTSANFPTTVDTNYGVVGASTIRTAAEIGNATGAANFDAGATTAQTLRVVANLNDATGTPFSASNPLPVTIDTISGTAVDDYKDAAAVGAGASDVHSYTVTAGKTFYFDQVIASASGKAKMLIAVETGVATNVFTTKFVQFNSTAETNMNISLIDAIAVPAGVRVEVTMTNKDNQAQDLYSTICGHEI